jgi:putative transposase
LTGVTAGRAGFAAIILITTARQRPVRSLGGPSLPSMPLPTRKQLPHDAPAWVKSGSIFFITICCLPKGENQLCQPEIARNIFASVHFRHERLDWCTHLFLLMPDHLHGLLSVPYDQSMKSTISKWKEYTAKHVGIRWQRDFFDHRLRNDESFDEKANYIRMNPVRENLILEPSAWPYVWVPDR